MNTKMLEVALEVHSFAPAPQHLPVGLPQPIRRRAKFSIAPLLIVLAFTLAGAGSSRCQTYSEDLEDIQHLNNPLRPIGNIGKLERILDLRGFVPLSCFSKKKQANQNVLTRRDINQWYKYPTRQGTQLLYYGAGDKANTTKEVWVAPEGAAAGEDRTWVLFAYELGAKQGKSLFQIVGDGQSYEGSEPIAIWVTQSSAIVIVNMRYSNGAFEGTGQYLVALEFSRSLHTYKAAYLLYTTTPSGKSTKEMFKATKPAIDNILPSFFSSQ